MYTFVLNFTLMLDKIDLGKGEKFLSTVISVEYWPCEIVLLYNIYTKCSVGCVYTIESLLDYENCELNRKNSFDRWSILRFYFFTKWRQDFPMSKQE